MLSLAGLIATIIYLIVAGLIFYLLYWLLGVVALPEPFQKIATVILAIAAVLVIIGVLLNLVGHPIIRMDL